MNKTLLLTILGLVTICRVSFGADNLSKTSTTNHSLVEVKCQNLTAPSKILEKTGLEYLGSQSFPGLAGVFNKNQLDVYWKALKGQEGVLIQDIGNVTVKSGESGKIQKGYDFSYPVDYDATGKPAKMETVFLGTKLEVKPVVSDIQIDLYLNLETMSLTGLSKIYSIKEADQLRKPTFEELVSTLPKHPVFDPVIRNRACESNLTIYTGQTIFYSMDDNENSDLLNSVVTR